MLQYKHVNDIICLLFKKKNVIVLPKPLTCCVEGVGGLTWFDVAGPELGELLFGVV